MGNSLICSRPPMQTLSSPPQAEHTAIQNPVQLPTPLPSMSSSSHKPDAVSSQSAFTSLHSEALSGNCTAQFRLGLLYDLGTLSDQPELTVGSDPAHANYWYLLAAKQNHIGAQYNLALNYQNGAGCSKNLVKASKWFLKAAKLGCVDAQVNIANYYRRGWGRCCQDNVASMAWFLLAAQNGDATAQFILAQAYQHGKGGLAIDLIEAHNWCQRAADQGHQPASLYLERLDQDPNGEATDAAHDQHEPEDDCESSSDSEIASAVKAYGYTGPMIPLQGNRSDEAALATSGSNQSSSLSDSATALQKTGFVTPSSKALRAKAARHTQSTPTISSTRQEDAAHADPCSHKNHRSKRKSIERSQSTADAEDEAKENLSPAKKSAPTPTRRRESKSPAVSTVERVKQGDWDNVSVEIVIRDSTLGARHKSRKSAARTGDDDPDL